MATGVYNACEEEEMLHCALDAMSKLERQLADNKAEAGGRPSTLKRH